MRAGSTPAYLKRTASSAARVPLHTTWRTRGAQLDVGGRDPRARAGRVAVGAVVVAEMAEQHRVVDVGRSAAAAVLGVRRVLEARQREARVLDAEEQRLVAQIGDQRVVGV